MQKEFNYKYANFKEEDGIIFSHFDTDTIDFEIAKELIQERLNFTQRKDSIIYIDGTKVKTISKQARDYFGSKEGTQSLIAVAIFTNSKLSAFLANFLMKVNLSSFVIPIKLFSDKNKAIVWLNKYK